MQNFPSWPHLHLFKGRPVSPKGPIAVFSPQKNHFLKMKHSTFLESRKSGCSFYIQWPFHFSARSVSTPASHLDCEFLGGRNLSYSSSVSSLMCPGDSQHPKGRNSNLTHLFLCQCLAQDGSDLTQRAQQGNVCQIELVWWGKCVDVNDKQGGCNTGQIWNRKVLLLLHSGCVISTAHGNWAFYYTPGAPLKAFHALTHLSSTTTLPTTNNPVLSPLNR